MMFALGFASGIASMVIVSGGVGWWLGRHPRMVVRHFLRSGKS